MVYHGEIRYDMVWCDICSVAWYDGCLKCRWKSSTWYVMIRYDMLWKSRTWYDMIWYAAKESHEKGGAKIISRDYHIISRDMIWYERRCRKRWWEALWEAMRWYDDAQRDAMVHLLHIDHVLRLVRVWVNDLSASRHLSAGIGWYPM